MEPAEQFRFAVPGAVEHPRPLSRIVVLSFVTTVLVAGRLLSAAPVFGRAGDVPAGAALDGQLAGRGAGGYGFRLQRADPQLFDVAQ